MGIFRRNRSTALDEPQDELPAEPSLEEIEENPELLAAEAAVNELPPPPPTGTSWVQGGSPGMVTFPGPEPDEVLEDEPAGERDSAEEDLPPI
jgi:hypothetical protein